MKIRYLTEQTVFNKIVKHLRQQGRKSKIYLKEHLESIPGTNCAYRGKDGLKCAIGCLIPNRKYKPTMEGQSPREVLRHAGISARYKYVDDGLLRDLQSIHDDYHPVAWEKAFREIAIQYELKYTPPVKS
jgi:hypothetical protein